MSDALRLRQLITAPLDTSHCALSLRHITRPLVPEPELLTPEEESYFLPYVFNIHESEFRTDYTDLHGYRIALVTGGLLNFPALESCVNTVRQSAKMLESTAEGPDGEWLAGLAVSLRMWASLIESCHNFYFGQVIRDRN